VHKDSVNHQENNTEQTMKKYSKLLILFINLISPWAGAGAASDLEKEKRWSEQIADSLLVGESVELKAGDTAFMGIFTEASDGPTGRAVILAHGMGVHPDWPDIINPLRSDLPDHGWSTLSIQMPILANDAALEDYAPLFDEVAPRVEAAINFLREQNNQTIVLLGHSLGASMAARYLSSNGQQKIQGFVAIGLSVTEGNDKMNSALALEKIRLPVLDLYGSRDLDGVLSSVRARKKAARKAGNANYQQLEIEGADHFFVGMEDTLTRRVYGWLKTNYEKQTR
jgi:pimeloyl-ACP methyl ester carboxylesterase